MKQGITSGIFSKFKLQNSISLIIVIMCFLTITSNLIIGLLERMKIQELILDNSVWLVFCISIPFLIDILLHRFNRVIQLFQISVIAFTAIISILDDYNGFFGISLWIVSFLLIYRYDFIKRRNAKISLLFLFLISINIQISATIKGEPSRTVSILLFIIFIIILLYSIYRTQIIQLFNLKDRYPNDIIEIEKSRQLLIERITVYKKKSN